jgi:hypothetical protein
MQPMPVRGHPSAANLLAPLPAVPGQQQRFGASMVLRVAQVSTRIQLRVQPPGRLRLWASPRVASMPNQRPKPSPGWAWPGSPRCDHVDWPSTTSRASNKVTRGFRFPLRSTKTRPAASSCCSPRHPVGCCTPNRRNHVRVNVTVMERVTPARYHKTVPTWRAFPGKWAARMSQDNGIVRTKSADVVGRDRGALRGDGGGGGRPNQR